MDIKEISQASPHFYDSTIPAVLERSLRTSDYRSLLDYSCGAGD